MNKFKICLDAGHGGSDPGAVNGKRYESNDTLKIAKRLGKVLKANGLDICYTRKEDIKHTVSQKADIGNKSGAGYFISIHRNAAVNTTANGVEVLICNNNCIKPKMAKAICDNLIKKGFKDRGVKMRNDLTVLTKTNIPALLIEVGFISNDADNKLLDEKFNSVVNSIAKGIMSSLGLKFQTLAKTKEDNHSILHEMIIILASNETKIYPLEEGEIKGLSSLMNKEISLCIGNLVDVWEIAKTLVHESYHIAGGGYILKNDTKEGEEEKYMQLPEDEYPIRGTIANAEETYGALRDSLSSGRVADTLNADTFAHYIMSVK